MTEEKNKNVNTGLISLEIIARFNQIDIDMRDRLPLLCSGSSVLVVAGMDISENVKIDSTTDQIVKLDFKA